MAGDFDRQDERRGPLDIFIMALYRVDKFGGGGVIVGRGRGRLGVWGGAGGSGPKRSIVQCVSHSWSESLTYNAL